MNVRYLSCCVEEKQNAFNMLKEELCTSRSFPSALSSLYLEKQTQCRTGAGQEVQQTEPKHRNQHSSIPIADYMLRDYGSDHNRRILNNNNNRCREIRKKNTKGLSVEETRLTGEAQGAWEHWKFGDWCIRNWAEVEFLRTGMAIRSYLHPKAAIPRIPGLPKSRTVLLHSSCVSTRFSLSTTTTCFCFVFPATSIIDDDDDHLRLLHEKKSRSSVFFICFPWWDLSHSLSLSLSLSTVWTSDLHCSSQTLNC